MFIYIIGVLITVMFMALAHHFYLYHSTHFVTKKINILSMVFVFFSVLPLSLISGLRKGIGTDYYFTYYRAFYSILAGDIFYKREPLFNYLNQFIQLFTTDAQWLFVITSFIFVFFWTFFLFWDNNCFWD